jgi:hypothetical protein
VCIAKNISMVGLDVFLERYVSYGVISGSSNNLCLGACLCVCARSRMRVCVFMYLCISTGMSR